jgi:hypothetical protein
MWDFGLAKRERVGFEEKKRKIRSLGSERWGLISEKNLQNLKFEIKKEGLILGEKPWVKKEMINLGEKSKNFGISNKKWNFQKIQIVVV